MKGRAGEVGGVSDNRQATAGLSTPALQFQHTRCDESTVDELLEVLT